MLEGTRIKTVGMESEMAPRVSGSELIYISTRGKEDAKIWD